MEASSGHKKRTESQQRTVEPKKPSGQHHHCVAKPASKATEGKLGATRPGEAGAAAISGSGSGSDKGASPSSPAIGFTEPELWQKRPATSIHSFPTLSSMCIATRRHRSRPRRRRSSEVTTYNVHFWTDLRGRFALDAILDTIRGIQADVLCLQEVSAGCNQFCHEYLHELKASGRGI